MSALIVIDHVERVDPIPPELIDCFIDFPRSGVRAAAQALEVEGWVLSTADSIRRIEFTQHGLLLRRVPVGKVRRDIADAFPSIPGAAHSGFSGVLNLFGPSPTVDVRVNAVLRSGTTVPFAAIRGRRCWRQQAGISDTPLVSVIIPCYNQAQFLPEAIESVLGQTYPHLEIVVIDDGSPDEARTVAERYPGIRCVRQSNQGLSAARNTGIRVTQGEYLLFLDADDRLLPAAVEIGLLQLQAHPECAFVSGHYININADGQFLSASDLPCSASDHYESLLKRNFIGSHATVLYRRAVFDHVIGFDSHLRTSEDYDLYLRIARDFPIVCHHQTVAEYRQHGQSASSRSDIMLRASLRTLRLQRKHVRRNVRYRRALATGEVFWRSYYGRLVADELVEAIHRRQWRSAMRSLRVLLRFNLRALPGVVLKAWGRAGGSPAAPGNA